MCRSSMRAAKQFSTLSTAKSTLPRSLKDTDLVIYLAAKFFGAEIVLKELNVEDVGCNRSSRKRQRSQLKLIKLRGRGRRDRALRPYVTSDVLG